MEVDNPPSSPRAPRPVVAIVGRPNVGKSTLFNRLIGKRAAIVEDVPGVTRDRNYADFEWDNRGWSVVDTGGFEPESRDRLMQQVKQQAQLAVDEASAVVLVVDGRDGLTDVDRAVAELLRRSGKPLFVAVNKMDHASTEAEAPLAEFYSLGFGSVHAVSAEHGRGVNELVEAMAEKLSVPELPPPPEEAEEPEEVAEEDQPKGDIRIAIVGRPNVGKSTMVNALLGEERFVVSDVPGTTRDSIDSVVEHKGRRFVVTDTAGIRRKRSIALKVEAYSVVRSMKAIDQAEVVACLLDATEAGVEQDARLLGLVAEKAKALVVVVNKWDLAEREGATQDWYRKELLKRLPFVGFAPFVFTSAKERRGVTRVLERTGRLITPVSSHLPVGQLAAHLLTHSGFMLPTPEIASVRRAVKEFLTTPVDWYMHLALAAAEHPRVSLRSIRVPTAFVAGRYDILASSQDMRTAAERIPGATYVELPGSHFLQLEHPDPVHDELHTLLGRLA